MTIDIEWLGHSCFVLYGNDTILIDPFLTDNPVAAKRPDELECDIVAVTHGHGDHLGDAVSIAKRTGATLVGIHEVTQYAAQEGVETLEGMNIGGTISVKNSTFTMVPAWHSSGIGASGFHFDGGTPAGYVIDCKSGMTVYHAGDTGIFSDMKLIAELYEPTVACLPIGSRYTMGPREAALATQWLKVDHVIPMHYNTFDLIAQEPEEFCKRVADHCGDDTAVIVLEPGARTTID